jgi:hypothetical protein
LSGAFHAPLNGELLRQRLVVGAINENIKNAPPSNPLEPRVASPSDSGNRRRSPQLAVRQINWRNDYERLENVGTFTDKKTKRNG